MVRLNLLFFMIIFHCHLGVGVYVMCMWSLLLCTQHFKVIPGTLVVYLTIIYFSLGDYRRLR